MITIFNHGIIDVGWGSWAINNHFIIVYEVSPSIFFCQHQKLSTIIVPSYSYGLFATLFYPTTISNIIFFCIPYYYIDYMYRIHSIINIIMMYIECVEIEQEAPFGIRISCGLKIRGLFFQKKQNKIKN